MRSRFSRFIVFLICTAACTPMLPSQSASAATWSSLRLPGEAAEATLFGIACPSISLCVAVGGNNTIASSRNPAGGPSAWDVGGVGAGSSQGASNFRQIRGVSCPTVQLCVAVSFEGLVFSTEDPGGGASTWKTVDLDPTGPNTHIYGISCPTAQFCAASAGGAKILTSTDPTGDASAWQKTELEGPLELRGVSCASAASCVVVGDDGDSIRPGPEDHGVILTSTNPMAGEWQRAQPPISGNAYGVACPSAGLCVSGDLLGDLLVSTAPSSPTSWSSVNSGGSVQISDVDCPTTSLCAAVDLNGDVITSSDPTGGAAAWSIVNVAPYPGVEGTRGNGLFGLACPSALLCAASAADGQIFTSTDPFSGSESTEGPSNSATSGKHRYRPKRPRVAIPGGPPPETQLKRGPLRTLFRFFAMHHAQVRGFSCRIDHRALRRCKSPKRFRVGIGRHTFRVRAIGWTGIRGPVATKTFWVCHPRPRPGCGKSKIVTAAPERSSGRGAHRNHHLAGLQRFP